MQLRSNSAEVTDKVTVGQRFIDEGILGQVDNTVLKDRRFLSEDGFLVAILRVDRLTGKLVDKPELVSRGFVLAETSTEFLESIRNEIARIVSEVSEEEKQNREEFNQLLHKSLKRFIRKRTGKRPIILPVFIEM